MPGINYKRLFIAVEFPQHIISILKERQEQIKKSGVDAKWVSPHNIHLTLKFLGKVPAEKIESLSGILDSLFSAQKSFQVILSELGYFHMHFYAQVIWAGLKDPGMTLNNIVSNLDDSLSKLGFKKEGREFQPHATLARLRFGQSKIPLTETLDELNLKSKKTIFFVDNITLFESRLSPEGPAYFIIHKVKLK